MGVRLLTLLGVIDRLPLFFLYAGLSIQEVWLDIPFLASIYGFAVVNAWHFFLYLYQNKWYGHWHTDSQSFNH